MRVNISELKQKKIIEFTTNRVLNDPKLLKNRQFVSLFMAPRALIEFRGKYYLPTKTMAVEDAGKYTYSGSKASITIPIHVIFADGEKLKYDPMPAFDFTATIEEVLAEWSAPLPGLYAWFEPELVAAWSKHLLLTNPQ